MIARLRRMAVDVLLTTYLIGVGLGLYTFARVLCYRLPPDRPQLVVHPR
jgi:hypothetical protein